MLEIASWLPWWLADVLITLGAVALISGLGLAIAMCIVAGGEPGSLDELPPAAIDRLNREVDDLKRMIDRLNREAVDLQAWFQDKADLEEARGY